MDFAARRACAMVMAVIVMPVIQFHNLERNGA